MHFSTAEPAIHLDGELVGPDISVEGLPLTLLNAPQGVRWAVLEMGYGVSATSNGCVRSHARTSAS
jgi:hypothetical protein